jgi:hypothetical protein
MFESCRDRQRPTFEKPNRIEIFSVFSLKCPRCNGTGFPVVKQPAQANRKIYPAPYTKCGGRGIKEAAN